MENEKRRFELAVGETGVINGKKVRCEMAKAKYDCTGCAFMTDFFECDALCLISERTDKTEVIYKLIEEETK